MSTEFKVNQEVEFNESVWTITEISRGWISLANEQGDRAKTRAKQLCHTAARTIASQLKKYRVGYVQAKTSSGEVTYHNGDDLAEVLFGLEPADVCAVADIVLDAGDGYHMGRYGHLNAGQQRMNAGNRIRAALKKESLSIERVRTVCATLHTIAAE